MKHKMIILLAVALLSSCAAPPEPAHPVRAEEARPVSSVRDSQAYDSRGPKPESGPGKESEPEIDSGDELENVYIPDRELSSEELIDAYFEQLYLAWSNLEHIDISSILDIGNSACRNMLKWSESLILRRRLLMESGFCYVDTERLPYTIEYDREAEDDRMELWRGWLQDNGTEVLHFRIRGEKGMAYPPVMAINSQHSMFFKEVGGELKITLHYFPGSVRKFTRAGAVRVPSEEAMLEQLSREFKPTDYDESEAPPGALVYDGDDAAEYAIQFTEEANPDFYEIIDWVGNCANFVSQCVWAGFGGGAAMTGEWAGNGGGTPAWENVNYFWRYTTSGGELRGLELGSAAELRNGDIIQIRTSTITNEPERYHHMMIVVDEGTLLLAQNSPDCFVYYSDLVNVDTRFIRPSYLQK